MRRKKCHLLFCTILIIGSIIFISIIQFDKKKLTNKSNQDEKYNNLLDDLFVAVKTTEKFHTNRIDLILKTWYTLAPKSIYFFTDSDEKTFYKQSPSASNMITGHIINTNCSSTHNRQALCCKMNVELEFFLRTNKKWFCHVDDDNYINIPKLIELLSSYNSNELWYLGKPSITAPLQILDRRTKKRISFWFATGGAGFCVSRSLLISIKPVISGGKFIQIGSKIRLPDDVTLGYIISYMMKVPLTVVEQFHSHLEPLNSIKLESISEQITFSYSKILDEMNTVKLPDGFDISIDPTRMLSLHCFLFPTSILCHKLSNVNKVI